MKKSELRQIIKEELSKFDREGDDGRWDNDEEYYERMDGLVNQPDLKLFIQSASKIMQDLTTREGFETKDVYEFLYRQMLNNV